MIDLLVISTASVTAINRKIYGLLLRQGTKVEMVIPVSYPVSPGRFIKPEEPNAGDPPIHLLKLTGSNPRTFYFPDLESVIIKRKPRVVLIENDPVSYMAARVGRISRRYG